MEPSGGMLIILEWLSGKEQTVTLGRIEPLILLKLEKKVYSGLIGQWLPVG
jgi:hypothetical protein